jgi:hypothetical protein
MRLPEDLIKRIDEYRQSISITRGHPIRLSDAIRELLCAGIESSNRSFELPRKISARLPGNLIYAIDRCATRADTIRRLLYAGVEAEKNQPSLPLEGGEFHE